jgi:hypothetical protein
MERSSARRFRLPELSLVGISHHGASLEVREERLQRAKHFTGPATKSRCSADQHRRHSMSASVILMMLTDEDARLRDRLLIVPGRRDDRAAFGVLDVAPPPGDRARTTPDRRPSGECAEDALSVL